MVARRNIIEERNWRGKQMTQPERMCILEAIVIKKKKAGNCAILCAGVALRAFEV